MKQFLALAALVGAAAVHAGPTIGFTGDYAPANWAFSSNGNGSASMDATSASITSPDDVASNGNTRLTVTIKDDGPLTFDWAFTTQDDPFFELFGYELNGLFTQLMDEFGSQSQTGSALVMVNAGDTFAFRQWAIDDLGGPSTTRIGNFTVAVPEPGALALVALALAAAAAVSRRRIPIPART